MGSRDGSKGPGGGSPPAENDSKMADQMPRTAALPGQTAPEIESLYQLLLLSDVGSEPATSAPAAATKKRKKSKHGVYLDSITREQLTQLMNMPTEEASKVLGIGTTSFKRVCRRHGIESWPYKSLSPPEGTTELGPSSAVVNPRAAGNVEEQQLLDLATRDISNTGKLNFPPDALLAITSLKDTMSLSQEMRKVCGVSIFNDGVLLRLLERLTASAATYTDAEDAEAAPDVDSP